ncbi:HAD family hydrolase [Mesoplasma lactucae]|uniref:Uncharacterized protein n=1 Tax=Mesoplasma lactucae ATCC 49193 TaxID=81460 RepID=A0A291IR78_9MOLU|nr:HAD hydrolase family protein [Mesoplasma lactucae]ATG97260.1 hypothetical protein CP520_00600 [Mesoplasma lactucae ATCC 49193]ATZ20292.1 hypothetical protein MLACT_v1c04710 [Mesoplasma lactucae ATCC 49193]MCL8216463.1 hypothetical protein [Mesoplasma lactucae ATCC 49193]
MRKELENIKMIATDIDGTLLTNDYNLSDQNQMAITELVADQVYFVMDTGGLPQAGYQILTEGGIGVTEYTKWFIGSNGSVIFNFITNESFVALQNNNVKTVEKTFKKLDFKRYEIVEINKVDYARFIVNDFNVWYQLFLVIYDSVAVGNDKNTGLINLLSIMKKYDKVNIKQEEVIYFGDNKNDIPVFKNEKIHCVAVNNAIDELLNLCNEVTSDNNKGISDYLNKNVSTQGLDD